jgi:hypothetical protein
MLKIQTSPLIPLSARRGEVKHWMIIVFSPLLAERGSRRRGEVQIKGE